MAYEVDFKNVVTDGLESSPVAEKLAGLRANEARYFCGTNTIMCIPPIQLLRSLIWWH